MNIAIAVVIAATAWLGLSGVVACIIGKIITDADRRQAARHQEDRQKLERNRYTGQEWTA